MLKKSNQNLHLAKKLLKIANLFVEKTFDLNKNYIDKIFINKYSNINRKIDTLTIYGTKTINQTINNFQQVSMIL